MYQYGAIYSDIDNFPPRLFKNGTVIHSDDKFFASSDPFDRPLQNNFAIEPQHPIAYFTVQANMKKMTKKMVDLEISGLYHREAARDSNRHGKSYSCLEYLYRPDHSSKEDNVTKDWSLNPNDARVV